MKTKPDTTVSTRIDLETKQRAAEVLQAAGLTVAGAVRLFLRAIAQGQGIPLNDAAPAPTQAPGHPESPATPPERPATGKPGQDTYPISQKFNLEFTPYEDRLLLTAERQGHDPARVLLTRRMVMIILQQLLRQLPQITGLTQTPSDYWQEILRMDHQQAMHKHSEAATGTETKHSQHAKPSEAATAPANLDWPLYLATELNLQIREKELVLAFKGLELPGAWKTPLAHAPILAAPLKIEHVHQLLHLLIAKAQAAHWNLPVELPWMDENTLQEQRPGPMHTTH